MKKFEEYLQSDNSIDVISQHNLADYELFFGPILPNTKPFITSLTNIGEILFELGLAQSKSWCRKNNWYKELEYGYQEIVFGFKRYKLCILVHEVKSDSN